MTRLEEVARQAEASAERQARRCEALEAKLACFEALHSDLDRELKDIGSAAEALLRGTVSQQVCNEPSRACA